MKSTPSTRNKTNSYLSGNRLHVINLSQQSDSVDLLGGYKPYDSTLVVKQIFRDFSYEQTNNEWIEQVQVRSIWIRSRSNEIFSTRILFLMIVQKSIQAKKYKEAVKLMIKYTESNSTLKIQLLKLRESLKSNSKSALLFRFVEVSKQIIPTDGSIYSVATAKCNV